MTTPLDGDPTGAVTTSAAAAASKSGATTPNDTVGTHDHHHDRDHNNLLQVIVMSEAGKPIFSYRDDKGDKHDNDDDDVARMCGLVQAVRTSLLYSSSGGGGGVDLQGLRQTSPTSSSSCSTKKSSKSTTTTTTTRTVVFTVGSITLVAILSYKSTDTVRATDFSLRLLLEYVYAQIVFALTDQVQTLLAQNASLNVHSLLSPSTSTLRSLLQQQQHQDPAPWILASVPTVFPLSPAVRERTMLVLQQVGDVTPNTVFALLIQIHHSPSVSPTTATTAATTTAANAQLIALVQPSFRPHQLTSVDLHLLMHFLAHQQQQYYSGVTDNNNNNNHSNTNCEFWSPVCLPRFHSTGFLHCFAHTLDTYSNSNNNNSNSTANQHKQQQQQHSSLLLALISQDRSTEQFQLFRSAAVQIRQRLGIPRATETVLQIHSSAFADSLEKEVVPRNRRPPGSEDVSWTRTTVALDGVESTPLHRTCGEDHDHVDEDDENCSSSHHQQQQKQPQTMDDDDYEIVAHPDDCSNTTSRPPKSCRLLEELREIHQVGHGVSCRVPSELDYMNDPAVEHFAFRIDVPIHNQHHGTAKPTPSKQRNLQYEEPGMLSQCLSRSNAKDANRTNIWNLYQKLSLRLRLGSASDERVKEALETLTVEQIIDVPPDSSVRNPSISKDCSAMRLVEQSPRIQGVTYITMDNKTYLAMNGQGFEMYLVAASSLPAQQIAAQGAKLVRRLIAEEDVLFVSRPLTWSK